MLLRYGLATTIILAGVIVLAIGKSEFEYGGSALIGAGTAVLVVSWFYRFGVSSDLDREREDRARQYFQERGRWPRGS
jgi:hypothetical protein